MRTRLRLVEEEDLAFLKELRSDPTVMDALLSVVLLNDYRQKRWFEAIQGDKTKIYGIFEVLADERWNRAGLSRITDIDFINRSASVGGDLHASYRGKGLGKHLYRHIFNLCFDYYNLHRLWLVVLANNNVAVKLYQSLGFVEEGRQRDAILRHGKYQDCIMMSYLQK